MSRLAAGVLMPGFPGTQAPDWMERALADGVAGVCLFAENTPDVATARALTDELRARRPGLVVALDEEGGDVTRLQAGHGSSLPGAAALGAAGDEALTRACGRALGRLLALAGVDLDLAPCLDVAAEPLNPVIGVRAFGADPDVVRRHGGAFAAGLRDAGVTCCGKHYPGHGSTRLDSHLDLPVLDVDPTLLQARDLAPFEALLGCGAVDAVMTGHLVVPDFGPDPATLSRWATEAIRGTGFDGAILTDALGMRAITDRLGFGEACVRALEAGADLLLLDAPHLRDAEATYAEALDAVEAALATGRLEEDALRASADRAARLQRREATAPADLAVTIAAAEEELGRLGQVAAARAPSTRGDVVLAGPPLLLDIRRRTSYAAGRSSGAFAEAVRRTWVAAEVVVPLDEAEALATLDVAPVGHDVVVLTRDARSHDEEGALLGSVLAARPDALVVHTGVAQAAPDVPRLACCLGNGAANADALVARLGAATAGGGGA